MWVRFPQGVPEKIPHCRDFLLNGYKNLTLRVRTLLFAPIPLSTFAGEPSQNVGKSFIKSYCAVLLEGAVIVLACIIFSVFAASPPQVDTSAAAVTQVWAYVGELIFNMLILVGSVKMSDRIIREMMGL